MAENHEIVELGNTNCNWSASPSSSSVYHSTRIEGLLQSRTNYKTAIDFEIAASKDHWSELQPSSVAEDSSGGEKENIPLTNKEIVLSLRSQFPQTGDFFWDACDSVELGQKIAEGAQAEIFEAKLKESSLKFVLKVFKEGSSVLELQKQWPLGMLNHCKKAYFSSVQCSPVLSGTVVMNGRFAFRMFQFAGDLRKLIDKRMECNNRFRAPFCDEELQGNMLDIALGMEGLHKNNIVHRDLKASNVLIFQGEAKELQVEILDSFPYRLYSCLVADFECSVGVVGTTFWRVPEILQGVKARNITPNLFTKEANVYSYAMTCYEMITGQLPFEGVKKNNYDLVLQGDRPTLPKETKPWIKTLLNRCWHPNPKERPNFKEIVKCIGGR